MKTKKKNKEDSMGYEYDEAVLKCFFEAAGQAVFRSR